MKKSFFSMELLILAILAKKDCYGYEIASMIASQSDGVLELQEGAMYPLLAKLKDKEYISSYQLIINRKIRVYYHMEVKGIELYKRLCEEFYNKFSEIDKLLKVSNESIEQLEQQIKKENESSVIFHTEDKAIEIIDGSVGIYKIEDIERCVILNEKAKYKGKGEPFTALIADGPLAGGILQNPYLYVGIKLVMKDGSIKAIYISKEKTMTNTDQYLKDREKAEKIVNRIKKYISEISAEM